MSRTLVARVCALGLMLGAAPAVTVIALLGIAYWKNTAVAPYPTSEEIRSTRDKAISWFRTNEAAVLEDENPALWWMVRDSARLSNNAYLKGLYSKYYERYLASRPSNVWHHMFDQKSKVWIPIDALRFQNLPDYNIFFLYALSCQADLQGEPEVSRFLSPDACGTITRLGFLRNPACETHQLIGLRFMQQRGCQDEARTITLVKTMQDQIATASDWDFRGVVDFNIQRALVLAESGSSNRIKPRWVRSIIDAQKADGGWADFDPILSLGQGEALGWSGWSGWRKTFLHIGKPKPKFHTTAQGLYLMSLLAAHASAHALDDFRNQKRISLE